MDKDKIKNSHHVGWSDNNTPRPTISYYKETKKEFALDSK